MNRLLALVLIVFVAHCLACDRADYESSSNQTANANAGVAGDTAVSDAWVTAKVKLALLADQRVSGFATDVDTRDGAVTLSGIIDEQTGKTAAEEIARDIEGVRSVNNQLQVVPEASREHVDATDDKIEDDIARAMDTDSNLRGLDLTVESNAGVVTLDGEVATDQALVNAAHAIRKIPGVKAVVTTPVEVGGES